jgi:predicted metal-dependent HD superfamily phosphohydrolase
MKYPHESHNLNTLFEYTEWHYKKQPFKLDYHNFKHAKYVFEKLNEIGGLNPVTALAAIYHDVVYFTRANNGVCEGSKETS